MIEAGEEGIFNSFIGMIFLTLGMKSAYNFIVGQSHFVVMTADVVVIVLIVGITTAALMYTALVLGALGAGVGGMGYGVYKYQTKIINFLTKLQTAMFSVSYKLLARFPALKPVAHFIVYGISFIFSVIEMIGGSRATSILEPILE